MAISFNAGASNQFTFALMTDSGGLPGSILESWSLTTTFFTGCAHCFETVFSTQQLVLQAGTQYWLVPFPNHTMDANWDQNVVGALGTAAFSLDGGKTWTLNPESSMGAFDVRGISSTTVPEPSTFGFMATGLAGIYWCDPTETQLPLSRYKVRRLSGAAISPPCCRYTERSPKNGRIYVRKCHRFEKAVASVAVFEGSTTSQCAGIEKVYLQKRRSMSDMAIYQQLQLPDDAIA
jgi:hypothetical protein